MPTSSAQSSHAAASEGSPRVAEATSPVSQVFSPSSMEPYYAFSGVAEFITPSVEVGGSGAIVGAANVFPRACVHVYNLTVQGKREEATKAQLQLAKADWELTKRAISGFMAIFDMWCGYRGIPRGPMAALREEQNESLSENITWMMKIENSVPDYGTWA